MQTRVRMGYGASNASSRGLFIKFGDVLAWSFYPLVTYAGLQAGANFASLALLSILFSFVVPFSIGLARHGRYFVTRFTHYLKDRQLLRMTFLCSWPSFGVAFLSTLALDLTDPVVAALILESAPFLGAIFFSRLFVFRTAPFRVIDAVFFLGGLLGVALVIMSQNLSDSRDLSITGQDVLGMLCAAGAAVCLMLIMTSANLLDAIRTDRTAGQAHDDGFCMLMMDSLRKAVLLPPAYIAFVALTQTPLPEIEAVPYGFLRGGIINVLSSTLGALALVVAKDRIILVASYFAPALATAWLLVFGSGEFNDVFVFGIFFVTMSVLASWEYAEASRATMSVMIFFCLAISFVAYTYPGRGSGQYYDMVAAILVFYSVVASVRLSRIRETFEKRTELAISLFYDTAALLGPGRGEADLRERFQKSADSGNFEPIRALVNDHGTGAERASLFARLDFVQTLFSNGNAYVEQKFYAAITVILVVILLLFRKDGLDHDMFAVIASIFVVFLSALSFEMLVGATSQRLVFTTSDAPARTGGFEGTLSWLLTFLSLSFGLVMLLEKHLHLAGIDMKLARLLAG